MTRGIVPDGSNAPHMLLERFTAAVADDDWVAVGSLLSPDFVGEDRSRSLPTTWNQEQLFTMLAPPGIREVELRAPRLIVVRGTTTALAQIGFREREGERVGLLVIAEITPHGQFARATVFSTDQLKAAVRMFDLRFIASCTPGHRAVVHAGGELVWALTNGDAATVERHLSTDFVRVDYREEPTVRMDRAETLSRFTALSGAEANLGVVDIITKLHAVSDRAALGSRAIATPSTLGELSTDLALTVVVDGAVRVVECYPAGDVDLAMERFEDYSEGTPTLTW